MDRVAATTTVGSSERIARAFYQNLLGSFNAKEFKERMRMDVSTFEYLCSTLALDLHPQDTNMRLVIPMQVKIVVSISRLATCNSMQCIADLFRIGLSSSQLAVSEFCVAIKKIFLRNSSNGLLLPFWSSTHASLRTSTRFPTWWRPLMAPIYPSLHPGCMPRIITTAKGFIPSFCRA